MLGLLVLLMILPRPLLALGIGYTIARSMPSLPVRPVMISGLFWIGLIMDFISHHSANYKTMLFSTSRISNFFGSLIVFASVIIVGLPDYLEASNLDRFCPPCGVRFDKTVRQVAEFSIGISQLFKRKIFGIAFNLSFFTF